MLVLAQLGLDAVEVLVFVVDGLLMALFPLHHHLEKIEVLWPCMRVVHGLQIVLQQLFPPLVCHPRLSE